MFGGNLRVLRVNYEEKMAKFVYEYDLKMIEDTFSIQALSNELNATNNSKEELCQRVAPDENAYVEKEVDVGRLHREIDASTAAFNEKVGAEVLAANVAFNEKLAMQTLELGAHFDLKLDVELVIAKVFAIEQHSSELEFFYFEHELKLWAERDKYQKMRTLEMNKYNKLRDDYVNKLKKRLEQIGIRVAPSSQPCTANEEACVEGHAAPSPSCGVNIAVDPSVRGVERRCDGFLSSFSTTFNEKYLEVDSATCKEKLSSVNVAFDGVKKELILEHDH